MLSNILLIHTYIMKMVLVLFFGGHNIFNSLHHARALQDSSV